MAFEQGYYQAPRRPYTEQDASQATPRQTYGHPAQQYDQYQDDNYSNGYEDGYNEEGYSQDYGQPSRNGYGGWRENDYPLRQEYSHPPPQQGYYGNMREGWMSSQRETPPMQRSTISEGMRAGYEQRSGPRLGGSYPSSGAASKGSMRHPRAKTNPNHLGPRGQAPRKPLKTPPISPDQTAWDNPFPTFPGTKKKTSISEELEISQKMANMDMGPQPKVKGGSKTGRAPLTDEIHRTTSTESQRRGPPPEDYVRPALDQRSTSSRGYPLQGSPQSGYREPRNRSLASGQGPMSQSGYSDIDYSDRGYGQGSAESWARDSNGTLGRSMTMTNEKSIPTSRAPLQISADDVGPSAPYNGPVGRALPPRPATASGHRLAPQRSFQLPPMSTYPIDGGVPVSHIKKGSMVDFYEDGGADNPLTSQSRGMEMPDFEVASNKPHKRGSSFDQHIQDLPQQHNYGKLKAMKSQPNIRGQGHAQSAVFETAEAAPPMPKGPIQGYVNGYGQDPYQDTYNRGTVREPAPMEYSGYNELPVNGFQLPPRSASVAPPRSAYRGFPNGPPRQISDGILPSHPQPVRAGFIPNSVAGLPNNKPTPVRNYDNITPAQMISQSTGEVSAPESVPDSNPVTLEELELLRNKIKINSNDQTSQMLLARRLVEASEVLVQSIPDQRARNKACEKYVIDAHKLLKKLVLAQNTEAMFYLADCYGRGALGLETDNKEAFSLYQSAAKAGHAAAAYRTAVCCELGNEEGGGTRKDPLKAIQWYKRAAMLGDTPAMYKMGIVQLKGLLGQPRNPREAVGWLKRAADRADAENPHALHELALLYEQPQGLENTVVRDEAYSYQLFCQAAELGYKFSQFRLGCAYEYGLFHCPTDPRQSIMWYSRAAAQEEHQSELALSGWYLTGSEGVLQQSDTEAYLWARKAAMAGLAKAEYAMGYFTEVGIGAPANLEDAKRWYWRAAAQNFPKARERLEDLKRGGSKIGTNSRKHISRSKVGKQNEGECLLM